MRLFIAEKPSLARAIVAALPKPHVKKGDYIECGDRDVVAWCVGHIMEQAKPDEYDPKYKKWDINDLPITPGEWKLNITQPKLFKAIKQLASSASEIVNAGDPDREGQLLVDEVIEYIGFNKKVSRVLINDLNVSAVKKSLDTIQSNLVFKGLYDSALARSRADWLYGMNLTRLYTIQGRKGGYDGVLSVGRVQTPVLGLVVQRDKEINDFKSKPFYQLKAEVNVKGDTFSALWVPNVNAKPYLDEENRLISKEYANQLAVTLSGYTATIGNIDKESKKEYAPLPFSLSDLQQAASKAYDFEPHKTLSIAQSLYEKHELITYPRSDCPYLPEEHHQEAPQIAQCLSDFGLDLAVEHADLSLKSKAWNDKKVTAHHAIIPTKKSPNGINLSSDEEIIYKMIGSRYLGQFYGPYCYDKTTVFVHALDDKFKAIGKVETDIGYKLLNGKESREDEENENNEKEESVRLPDLKTGQAVQLGSVDVIDKKTTPPKHFTDATLLKAMTNIAQFVTNQKVKDTLKETDGIGTSATQANIIKTLFDRGYLNKSGKKVVATDLGKSFISILPESATTPDMSAYWEQAMKKIEEGTLPLHQFETGIVKQIGNQIEKGKTQESIKVETNEEKIDCPTCKKGFLKRRPSKAKGFFWGCSDYPECKQTFPDKRGKPDTTPKKHADATEFSCKQCGSPLVRRVSVKGKGDKKRETPWYGCSAFPKCKETYFEKNNAPNFEQKKEKESA